MAEKLDPGGVRMHSLTPKFQGWYNRNADHSFSNLETLLRNFADVINTHYPEKIDFKAYADVLWSEVEKALDETDFKQIYDRTVNKESENPEDFIHQTELALFKRYAGHRLGDDNENIRKYRERMSELIKTRKNAKLSEENKETTGELRGTGETGVGDVAVDLKKVDERIDGGGGYVGLLLREIEKRKDADSVAFNRYITENPDFVEELNEALDYGINETNLNYTIGHFLEEGMNGVREYYELYKERLGEWKIAELLKREDVRKVLLNSFRYSNQSIYEEGVLITSEFISKQKDIETIIDIGPSLSHLNPDLRAVPALRLRDAVDPRVKIYALDNAMDDSIKTDERYARPNLEYIQHNAVNPLPIREVDIIRCSYVLMHLTENAKEEIIENVTEALKEGGLFIYSDQGLHEVYRKKNGRVTLIGMLDSGMVGMLLEARENPLLQEIIDSIKSTAKTQESKEATKIPPVDVLMREYFNRRDSLKKQRMSFYPNGENTGKLFGYIYYIESNLTYYNFFLRENFVHKSQELYEELRNDGTLKEDEPFEVLDIGCGSANFLRDLRNDVEEIPRKNITFTGIDLKKTSSPEGIDIKEYDARELPVNWSNRFHLVVSNSTLRWVIDELRGIEEAYRVAGKGAEIIINVNEEYSLLREGEKVTFYIEDIVGILQNRGYDIQCIPQSQDTKTDRSNSRAILKIKKTDKRPVLIIPFIPSEFRGVSPIYKEEENRVIPIAVKSEGDGGGETELPEGTREGKSGSPKTPPVSDETHQTKIYRQGEKRNVIKGLEKTQLGFLATKIRGSDYTRGLFDSVETLGLPRPKIVPQKELPEGAIADVNRETYEIEVSEDATVYELLSLVKHEMYHLLGKSEKAAVIVDGLAVLEWMYLAEKLERVDPKTAREIKKVAVEEFYNFRRNYEREFGEDYMVNGHRIRFKELNTGVLREIAGRVPGVWADKLIEAHEKFRETLDKGLEGLTKENLEEKVGKAALTATKGDAEQKVEWAKDILQKKSGRQLGEIGASKKKPKEIEGTHYPWITKEEVEEKTATETSQQILEQMLEVKTALEKLLAGLETGSMWISEDTPTGLESLEKPVRRFNPLSRSLFFGLSPGKGLAIKGTGQRGEIPFHIDSSDEIKSLWIQYGANYRSVRKEFIEGLRLQEIALELFGEPLDAATIPVKILQVKEVPVNGKPVPIKEFLSEERYWRDSHHKYQDIREGMNEVLVKRFKKAFEEKSGKPPSQEEVNKLKEQLSKLSDHQLVEEFLGDIPTGKYRGLSLGDPVVQLISYAPSDIRVTDLREENLEEIRLDGYPIKKIKESMLKEVYEAHGYIFDEKESTKQKVIKKAAQRNGRIFGLALGLGIDILELTEGRNHIVGSVITDFDDLQVPMPDTSRLFAGEAEVVDNQQKTLRNLLNSMSVLSKFLGIETYRYMDEFISTASQTYARIREKVLENPEQKLFTQKYIGEYNGYLSQLKNHKLENQDVFSKILLKEETRSFEVKERIKPRESTIKEEVRERYSDAQEFMSRVWSSEWDEKRTKKNVGEILDDKLSSDPSEYRKTSYEKAARYLGVPYNDLGKCLGGRPIKDSRGEAARQIILRMAPEEIRDIEAGEFIRRADLYQELMKLGAFNQPDRYSELLKQALENLDLTTVEKAIERCPGINPETIEEAYNLLTELSIDVNETSLKKAVGYLTYYDQVKEFLQPDTAEKRRTLAEILSSRENHALSVGEEYLFKMPVKFESDLKNKFISDNLRHTLKAKIFETTTRHLSESVTITEIDGGWEILDENNGGIYRIKEENDVLKIYDVTELNQFLKAVGGESEKPLPEEVRGIFQDGHGFILSKEATITKETKGVWRVTDRLNDEEKRKICVIKEVGGGFEVYGVPQITENYVEGYLFDMGGVEAGEELTTQEVLKRFSGLGFSSEDLSIKAEEGGGWRITFMGDTYIIREEEGVVNVYAPGISLREDVLEDDSGLPSIFPTIALRIPNNRYHHTYTRTTVHNGLRDKLWMPRYTQYLSYPPSHFRDEDLIREHPFLGYVGLGFIPKEKPEKEYTHIPYVLKSHELNSQYLYFSGRAHLKTVDELVMDEIHAGLMKPRYGPETGYRRKIDEDIIRELPRLLKQLPYELSEMQVRDLEDRIRDTMYRVSRLEENRQAEKISAAEIRDMLFSCEYLTDFIEKADDMLAELEEFRLPTLEGEIRKLTKHVRNDRITLFGADESGFSGEYTSQSNVPKKDAKTFFRDLDRGSETSFNIRICGKLSPEKGENPDEFVVNIPISSPYQQITIDVKKSPTSRKTLKELEKLYTENLRKEGRRYKVSDRGYLNSHGASIAEN
ncbi:MAG: methyltransferase domain-containing protein, partial [Candidatus Altiarchaeota archaeon]|nr:methyltransferase domain-containing protein [Candidatus Altiarchaeota archaeon]